MGFHNPPQSTICTVILCDAAQLVVLKSLEVLCSRTLVVPCHVLMLHIAVHVKVVNSMHRVLSVS